MNGPTRLWKRCSFSLEQCSLALYLFISRKRKKYSQLQYSLLGADKPLGKDSLFMLDANRISIDCISFLLLL